MTQVEQYHKHNIFTDHYPLHSAWVQVCPAFTYQVVLWMGTVVLMVADGHMPFAQKWLLPLLVTATTEQWLWQVKIQICLWQVNIVETTVTLLHTALQVGGLRGLGCYCKQLHEVRHTGSLQGAHGQESQIGYPHSWPISFIQLHNRCTSWPLLVMLHSHKNSTI